MNTMQTPPEADSLQVSAVTEGALTLAGQYETFAVTTVDEYETGAQHLIGIKDAMKAVSDERMKITRPMDEAKKRVMSFFGQFSNRLLAAEGHVKRALLTFKQVQDRIAAEERRKQQERDEKREAKLRAEAEEKREQGKEARADILEDRADDVAAAPVVPEVPVAPKVAGISTRTVWKFEITDGSKVPGKYKTVDEKKIGAVVRALKGDTDIPGVRVYSEETMAAGRRG